MGPLGLLILSQDGSFIPLLLSIDFQCNGLNLFLNLCGTDSVGTIIGKLVDRIIDGSVEGKIGKTYEVKLEKPLQGDEAEKLASGLVLRSEPEKPLKPVKLEVVDGKESFVRFSLFEGRYHRLDALLAALGNQAISIHRTAMVQSSSETFQSASGNP